MKSWHRAFHTAAVCILGMGLGACTYHGAVKTNIYLPTEGTAPVLQRKLEMKVAVLRNKTLRPLRVRGGGYGVEINYNDALTNAVESSLGGMFMAVRLIDDPTKADSEELLAEYDGQYRATSRNDWSGNYLFATLFTVRLKDAGSGLVVAEVQHADEVQYSPPPGATAAAVVTGASLFLLSPITIPLTTMAIGYEAERLVEDSIRTSVIAASAKLVTNPRLIAFVRTRERSDTAGSGPARPDPGKTDSMPPSKYDDFLNAVVVVRSSRGMGSGFFLNKHGYLVTNRHVVGRDATVSVKLRTGTVTIGTVIASDVDSDLALISVPQESPAWLELARPEEGGIGSDVIAIGTPEGLSWSVTKGIVSALREVGATRLVQTDAPINHGNSGGPLILLESGRVIGVNTFGFRKDVAQGLNFAVGAYAVGAAFAPYLKR